MWKKILTILMLLCFTASCAGMMAQRGPSICETDPAAVNSWICQVAMSHNMTPEDLDRMLLDANALGVVFEAYKREAALLVISTIEQALIGGPGPMSYTGLINLIFKETAKAHLIAGIVSRNIVWFNSESPISIYDLELIRIHLRHQREMLGG